MADPSPPAPRNPETAPTAPAEPAAPRRPLVIRASDPWRLALRIVLLTTAVVVGLWLVVMLSGVLLRLLAAVILATGLAPLVRQLHRLGLPRGAAVLLIYLAFILAVVGFLVLVVPPLVQQTAELVRDAPQYGARIQQTLLDLRKRFPFLPPLDQQLAQQVTGLGEQIGAVLTQAFVVLEFALGVFSGLVSAVLVLLITLYLIVDGARIREYFLSFVAPARRERLRRVTDRIGERMGGWLIGQVELSLVIGVVVYLGLTVLGVQGALLLAVVAAVGEAIPIVGPVLSAIPAVIVALTQSPLLALATAIMYLVVQQLENNLLVPKIMERAVAIHPLAVIIALIIGGELLGIGGALVAVPVAAALAVILDELRWERLHPEEYGGVARAGPRAGATRGECS